MVTYLGSVFLYLGLLSSVVLALGYVAVFWQLGRKPARGPVQALSVLKPLKGVDEGLLDNLRAIATQTHPNYEVIFGAEDPNDPALDVARRVQAEFGDRTIRVIPGAFSTGLNPKVRVLRHLISFSQHEWIVISDSNVRPHPDYLVSLCDKQRESRADLVHSLLAGADGTSLGGRLEELQLNGWVSASISLSDAFGHSCVIGKSMMMNKRVLASVGGLAGVSDILAEDYILGAKLQKAGNRVAISPHLLPVVTGSSSVGHFFNRHVRWGQMRRRISPGFYLAELTGNPTPFFLASMCVASSEAFRQLLAAQLLKWTIDAIIYLRLSPHPSVRTLSLMPLKDLLVPIMWVLGGLRRTVNWRGRKMLVGAGSRLSPVTANGDAESGSESATWAPHLS